ncbi:MAG: hypothetical protein ACYCW6_23670 [Candidatus Xenobia bacterium]
MISPLSGTTSSRSTPAIPGTGTVPPLGVGVPGQGGDGFASSGEIEGADPQKDANTRAIVAGLLGGAGCT